jgi:hypothetical protein
MSLNIFMKKVEMNNESFEGIFKNISNPKTNRISQTRTEKIIFFSGIVA